MALWELSRPNGFKNGLIQLADEAGVALAEVRTHVGSATFPSVGALVVADLRGWQPVMGAFLDLAKIQQILEDAENGMTLLIGVGSCRFQMSAHIISGTRQ